MSAFNAKKNVGMASLQHSDNGDKSNRHEILRKEMVEFVKKELQCCLGSVAMPITMAILVDQYRQDTGDDLREIAPNLGFPTPDAMLQSEEFSDVVGCDYTEAALGSNATRDEKTLCYRVVPNNRTRHLIDEIVQSKEEREIQHKYRELSTRALMDNASVNTKVLEGKERVLAALGLLTEKDATNDGFVELIELQRKYQEIHGVMLDKEELRKYFPKTHMKKVFEYCMPDDIELGTRVEHSGSLFLRLKRPLEEILADLEEIRQHRHSSKPRQKPMTNGNNEESKPSSSGIVPLQPKENPPVVPTCQRTEKLYTNDVQLARKFGTKDDFEDEPLPSRKHHNFSFKYGDARPEQQDLPQEEIIPGLSSDNGISSTNGHTQGAPPKSNIGGRPRGNVEELEAIFSASKRNNLPRKPDQPNYLEKKNGWSSNLPQKKEFNNSNKTYTTRDNGNYTDGANSSDDDDDILEAGNKRLRSEKKKDFSVKPLGNTLKTEELLAKAGVRLDNSSAMPVSESESISAPVNFESNSNGDGWWQSKPAERRTEPGNNFLSRARDTSHASQPKTAHAEKYMRQVMENKNEGRARFWAGKLAEEENNTKASIVKPMARAAPGPIVPIKKSDDSESSWLKVKTSTQSEIKNGFGKYESDEEQAVPNGNDTNLQGGFGAMNGNSFKSRSPTRFTHRVPENSYNEPADYFSEKPSNKWEKPSEKSTKPAQYTRNFTSGNSFGGMRDVNPTAQNGKPKPVSGGSFFSKFKDQLPDNGVGSADREVATLLSNGVAEMNMDDSAQSKIHSLVAAINLFVMHRSPPVALTYLKEKLERFYENEIREGEFFKEKTWIEFIQKHCHNIDIEETRNGTVLWWMSRNDSGVKAALRDFANYLKETRY
ncbi:hypothetical protein Ddc_02377 [Ditylenchus destructor]|nr:hypothetical protein Ddc_02377 [Ditylenchus destructor]